jgi:hypothetical protein
VPTAGNLVAGELAINTADGKLFYKDSAGVVQVIGTKGGVGSSTTTQVLYNSSGLVVGSANMTFSGTALTLANDASISGLTVGKGGGAVVSNSAFGQGALNNAGTGNYVTAIGYQSLYSNTTGQGGTAVGGWALYSNTTGTANTGIGGFVSTGSVPPALYSNTTGSYNIAVGTGALTSNTTANGNTAVGYQAGYTGTTATQNAYFGAYAGYSTTTSSQNAFIGMYAGYGTTTGDTNTALGYGAYYTATTGTANTALGQSALYYTTTGSNNVAVGKQALNLNTTASANTAVGYQAGYSATTGGNNTFLGYQAGYTFNYTSGTGGHTTVGYQSGYSITTGRGNTLVGIQAGYSLTTGSDNTFIGPLTSNSGYAVTTGSKNSILGGYTGNQGGLDIRTASNYIVLSDGDGNPRGYFNASGYFKQSSTGTFNYAGNSFSEFNGNANSSVLASTNQQASGTIGNLSLVFSAQTPNNTTSYFLECADTTNAKCMIYSNGTISNRTGTYNTLSDAKLKENIIDATPKLDKLMDVKVRNYNLIGDELKQIGFVAQELETVFPSLIDDVPDLDENKEPTGEVTKGVKLTVMIPILVKALQELNAKVDAQAVEIATLKAK